MSCIHNYICQLPGKFDASVKDFKKQGFDTKVKIVALTALVALATFFTLGLSVIPAFIWAVKWLKADDHATEPSIFQELRKKGEDAKQRADCMANRLATDNLTGDHDYLLDLDLEIGREWTRADLTNGSQLQQLYQVMMRPVWNPLGFDAEAFVYNFDEGYGPSSYSKKSYIQQADFKQLIAMSAHLLYRENDANVICEDDVDYNDLTECGLTFVSFARNGVLAAWLSKAKELTGV